MVFVFDISGSMVQGRKSPKTYDDLEDEVKRVIRTLDDKTQFGLVAFAGSAHLYKPQLVPATSDEKQRAISWLRKRREVELDEEAVAEVADDAPGADSKIAAEDLSHTIARLMEKLSVDHRIVLQLAYFQEFSVGQIAEILDCPENTVKTRMFYARQRLRALLEAEGIEGAAA